MASHDCLIPIFLAVRNARKADRQPSSTLNNFNPPNPNWLNGELMIVKTGLPHVSRKRKGYLKE
jgi:hypothetical protein